MLFSTVIVLAIKNARRCEERRIRFVSLPSPSGLFTCWLPGSPLVSIGVCAVHLGTCRKCAFAARSRHTRTLQREAGCSSETDDNAGLGIGSNSARERSRKEPEPAAPPESRASISRHATLAILLCVSRFLLTAYMSVDLHRKHATLPCIRAAGRRGDTSLQIGLDEVRILGDAPQTRCKYFTWLSSLMLHAAISWALYCTSGEIMLALR